MTARDAQAELGRHWLAEMRHAADENDPALAAATLASLDDGLTGIGPGEEPG